MLWVLILGLSKQNKKQPNFLYATVHKFHFLVFKNWATSQSQPQNDHRKVVTDTKNYHKHIV